jgi:hypothetical protein
LPEIIYMPTVVNYRFILTDKLKRMSLKETFSEDKIIHRLLFYSDSPQNTKKQKNLILQLRFLYKKGTLSPNQKESILRDCGFEKLTKPDWKLKEENING